MTHPPDNEDYGDIDKSFDFLKYAKQVFGLGDGLALRLVGTDWGASVTPYKMGQVLLHLVRTGTLVNSASVCNPSNEVWKEELPTLG